MFIYLFISELTKWRKIFDGSIDGLEDVLDTGATVRFKEDKVELRVRHFSWFSILLSYITGSQTIHMDMVSYMHPPRVTDANIVYLNAYATREDLSKV